MLENVTLAKKREEFAPQVTAYWVARAREAGASWQGIADALGVTKQAAWERYQKQEADKRAESVVTKNPEGLAGGSGE